MFFWNSLAFLMIQWMLAISSLVPLPFLNPAWTSGSSQFMYCWSLAWRILSITLLACEMSNCAVVWTFFGFAFLRDWNENWPFPVLYILRPVHGGKKGAVYVSLCVCTRAQAQLCPTHWDPMDCRPPGSSVHGISLARILEWGAISSSWGSSWPRGQAQVSCVTSIGRQILYHWPPGKLLFMFLVFWKAVFRERSSVACGFSLAECSPLKKTSGCSLWQHIY